MNIQNLKYNKELMKTKSRLEKELKMVNTELANKQNTCNHIRVCIGWDGPYLYRDSSINLCLICGEYDPDSKYKSIEAYNYKKEEYSHGELKSYRQRRFQDIQQLTISIMTENPQITKEELIEKLNIIIKKDEEKNLKTEKRLEYK